MRSKKSNAALPDPHHASVPRSVRVAEEIQHILGDIFLTKVQFPKAGLLTVTKVDMSRDLRHASIYISLLNATIGDEKIVKQMIRRKKEIRYHLGHELQTKYVPQLRIILDKSSEYSAEINTILKDLHDNQRHSQA